MNSISAMRRILSESACHNGLWNGWQVLSPRLLIVSEILTFSNSPAVRRLSSRREELFCAESMRFAPSIRLPHLRRDLAAAQTVTERGNVPQEHTRPAACLPNQDIYGACNKD